MTVEAFTCPCSFAQRRLWLLARLNPGGCEYNISAAIHLYDAVDPAVLEKAVNELVARHESLRTTFACVDAEPVQIVASALHVPVRVRTLSGPIEAAREEARRQAAGDAAAPFDLERGPLLRVALLQLADAEFVIVVSTHHIVSDGWSMNVFFRELTLLYAAFASGCPSPLPDLPIQYADYAVWQQESLGTGLTDRLGYWQRELADAPLLHLVPTDFSRPPISTYRGRREGIQLDADLTAALQSLSRREGATLFMTLLACFAVMLSRYSGQRDLVVGTLTAGRDRVETEGLIGFFVNTLALRVDLAGNPSFSVLLRRVRETALGAYAHADVPFERLVEELRPDRDVSRNPLVQITFQLFNLSRMGATATESRAEVIDTDKGTAKFDLALEMWEEEGRIDGRMEYSTDLFEARTIRRMLSHLETIARAAVADPDRSIETLPLLTPAEHARQVLEWNDTGRVYPRNVTVRERFERQALRSPGVTAIVDGKREWTYEDLDRRAASIAERLIDLRVEAEAPVGVCMRRSAEMVAAMLGVWKAGAAYVPLNPDDHPSRLARLAAEARTSVVLSDMSVVLDHPCCVDVRDLPRASEMRIAGTHAVGTLAYVLFTSGSTGKPKGVAVEHRNTAALIDWATRCYSAEELSGVLASTSISFDLSVFELFAPLCSGGTVILAENLLLLPDLPAADRVTLINTVPSAMAALVRERSVPASVRVVNMAGEPLHPSLVEDIFRTTNVGVVYNLYGPTEDTTYSTGARIGRGERWHATIGRPLPNRQAYILDSHLQPVPIGVTGELYLGGHGVARGYLNQPELTAEKFILSPFYPGERLYKTGDLARYRDSGDIDFLGRADDQIKLRGFRIEPGEIIAALRERSRVRDAYVMVRGAGSADASLVAYVVPAHPEQDAQAIRRDLDEALPPYMVPSAIVLLDKLPNTRHGKVDRAALPAPERPVPSAPRPRTALERDIAAAWQEVLSLPAIGLTETFFELGGHSLLLVRLQGRLRDTVGEVPLLDLFRFPTVRALAAHLSDRGTHRLAGIEAAQRRVVKQRERVRRPSPGRAQARER